MEHWGFKMGKLIDLTGQQFGKLTVIQRDGSINGHAAWQCKCSCGNLTIVSSDKLRSGHTQSCGCFQKEQTSKAKIQDLTNRRFHKLTVIKPAFSKDKRWHWVCKCDCGNITTVRGCDLISGRIHSCGCYRSEQLHKRHLERTGIEPGQKYNHLTILEYIGVKNHESYWKCQCDCGNIKNIRASKIKNGEIQSCGCLSSKGEKRIEELLYKIQIPFIKEYKNNICISPKGYPLRFDFYVNNSYLIEYDGRQHFEPIDFMGGEDRFNEQIQYDKIKNEYCKSHNIPLIRIPYWHYDNLCIEDLKPDTSQFLI